MQTCPVYNRMNLPATNGDASAILPINQTQRKTTLLLANNVLPPSQDAKN